MARRGPVGLALAMGVDLLATAGCETPRLDAELLLAEVLDPAGPVGRERLVIDRQEMLAPAAWERFEALVARRQAREPVAYILGRREFRWLSLAVDRRVLIPRPETELLVEVGLELDDGWSVVDVGTGSGAVALALASERPDLLVTGLDVDPDAVAVALANAELLGLGAARGSGGVRFAPADLLPEGAHFDAVLANLPYVPDGARLAPEIAWEPPGALFAGADGLDVVRRLIVGVADGAWRPSLLALEIAPEQAPEVRGLMLAAGFARVGPRHDLAGDVRVMVARG